MDTRAGQVGSCLLDQLEVARLYGVDELHVGVLHGDLEVLEALSTCEGTRRVACSIRLG